MRLVAHLYRARATGVMEVSHDGGLSRAYFREGFPAGANVFARFKPLGIFLLEIGWIDIEALDRSLTEVARTHRPQGELLVELGYLTPERLSLALRRQHMANLAELMGVTAGRWRFSAAEPVPAWTEDIAISPHEAVARSMEKFPERVESIVGPVGGIELALTPCWDQERHRFELKSDELGAFDVLREPFVLSDAPARTGLPTERVRVVLATALIFDLAIPAADRARVAASAVAACSEPATEPVSLAGALDLDILVVEDEPATIVGEPGSGGPPGAEARGAPEGGSAAARLAEPSAMSVGGADEPLGGIAPGEGSGALRDRRNKLLRRAFRNIPGAAVMSRAPGVPEAPAPAPEKASRPPKPQGTLTPEAREFEREVDARHEVLSKEDFYTRLGLQREAPLPAVKAAYLLLVKRYHPDRVAVLGLGEAAGAKLNAVFSAIIEAYECLTHPERRAAYDRLLEEGRTKGDRATARRLEAAMAGFRNGEVHFKRKEYAQALPYLEAAMGADPRNGLFVTTYAWARYSAGPRELVVEEVTALLHRALKLQGAVDKAHYYLGLLARMNDELALAEKHFGAAVAENPNFAEAVTELSVLRRRQEKKSESSSRGLVRRVLGKE